MAALPELVPWRIRPAVVLWVAAEHRLLQIRAVPNLRYSPTAALQFRRRTVAT
jgi:hypothetical protein